MLGDAVLKTVDGRLKPSGYLDQSLNDILIRSYATAPIYFNKHVFNKHVPPTNTIVRTFHL